MPDVVVMKAEPSEHAAALATLVAAGFPRAAEDGVTADEVVLLARMAGALVGVIHGRTVELGPVSVVDHLGVLPGYRRQGVGRALLDEYYVRERGFGAERIEVRDAPGSAERLRPFYEACGFDWAGNGFVRA